MFAARFVTAALAGRNSCARVMLTLSILLSAAAYAQDRTPAGLLPSAPSATPGAAASTSVDHSLTFAHRARLYGKSVFSPETIIGPALAAGVNQWENEPERWDQGGKGYARRFGSEVGTDVIGKTISFGFAAIDREDPRYFPSQDRSTWGRIKHGVVSSFVSPTASGRQIPAFSRFAGAYGAAFISNTWYPDDKATTSDAFKRGSTAFGAAVGFRVLSEFVPFLQRGAPK